MYHESSAAWRDSQVADPGGEHRASKTRQCAIQDRSNNTTPRPVVRAGGNNCGVQIIYVVMIVYVGFRKNHHARYSQLWWSFIAWCVQLLITSDSPSHVTEHTIPNDLLSRHRCLNDGYNWICVRCWSPRDVARDTKSHKESTHTSLFPPVP